MVSRTTHTLMATLVLAACLTLLVGCGSKEEAKGPPLPDGIMLASAPEGAQPVGELRATAEQGDEVVLRVIVGGRMEPIVQGRASAVGVDPSVDNACVTEDDDHCKTPWDYCCTPEETINANMVTIQVVDEAGRPIAADLTNHFDPLSTLVIKGVVGPRPEPEVFTINATGIYAE